MRGRVPGIRKDLERMGITPAYAGKSRKNGTCNRQIWDHPRVCGEELSAIGGMYYELGSPPRMRGRVIRGLATRITSGITPAYAGKSHHLPAHTGKIRDHPRVCGEEQPVFAPSAGWSGSPPRMRGRAHSSKCRCGWYGITPAYAGKSTLDCILSAIFVDHPRVCGEEEFRHSQNERPQGSPPRMRGRVKAGRSGSVRSWITPAYAGKSSRSRPGLPFCRDHPRVCGEEHRAAAESARPSGSPPRMRGRAWLRLYATAKAGITPAYAGKRLKKFHSIGHFSCILCLFHSVLHRASASGGSRAGPCAPPCLPAQNAVPV